MYPDLFRSSSGFSQFSRLPLALPEFLIPSPVFTRTVCMRTRVLCYVCAYKRKNNASLKESRAKGRARVRGTLSTIDLTRFNKNVTSVRREALRKSGMYLAEKAAALFIRRNQLIPR